jgi:hypothetical protein
LTSLLDVFLPLVGPVALLLLRVIVPAVNIVVNVIGSAFHCDFLLQTGFFFLLSRSIVLLVLEIDDIEVPAAVQLLLGVLSGQDDVAIIQVIVTEPLPVDQVVDVPDGRVVLPGPGGRRVGGGVSQGVQGDDVIGFIVAELLALNGATSTMYLFKERSISTACSFSLLGSCVL